MTQQDDHLDAQDAPTQAEDAHEGAPQPDASHDAMDAPLEEHSLAEEQPGEAPSDGLSADALEQDNQAPGEPVDMSDVETDMSSYEEVDQDSLLDFGQVRPQIEAILERNEDREARGFLEQIARFPDTTRLIEDNLWMYTRLGELRARAGEQQEALESFRAAYSFDPREMSLLGPYAQALSESEHAEEALRVMQSMLLYHKRGLGEQELVGVYRRMGACYEALERADKARASYEKALEQSSQDSQALEGLLRVVAGSDDPQEIIKVRQRLIRTLTEASARSEAIVSLGDDWVERFNDPQRAIETYEQALNEDPSNLRAVERIATVAAENEDWRRVSRSYFTLSRLSQDEEEEADWLIKASLIARDQLWEPEKALAGFKRALTLDPSRLDAFKIVTSILVDARDWEELKSSYVTLIGALKKRGDEDPALMVVLWQNLGELYNTHLENRSEAIIAFDQASKLMPQNFEAHEQVVELTEKDGEYLEVALNHLGAMRALKPGDFEIIDRIGRVYLRQKEVDKAYCVFRSLTFLGAPIDDKAAGFVERFQKPIYKAPKQPLTLELMKRYIFHDQLDPNISKVFTLIKPALAEWGGQTRSKYGLRRRDRIKLDEQLTFNNIYKSIGNLLQYPNLPELWRKPDQPGLINGALIPDGMIVGDELLGSGREKHVAFVIGKQLFLFLAPFYLAAVRPTDLSAFFMLAMNVAAPERHEMPLSGDMQSAHKALAKMMRGEPLARLQQAVQVVLSSKQGSDYSHVNQFTSLWLEAVEDSANRAGFIFCDDLSVCEDYLKVEPQVISQRPVKDRMRALADFSMSDEYVELRSILGINVA